MDMSLFHCLDLCIGKNKPFSKITDYFMRLMNFRAIKYVNNFGNADWFKYI